MNSREKFENFLESLKGNGQNALVESIKKGFRACFESEEIPVTTDTRLKTAMYKAGEKYKGLFSDPNYWKGVDELRDDLEAILPTMRTVKSQYDPEGLPNKWKRWVMLGAFKNPKGTTRICIADIMASGSGSVERPLDKYDITLVVTVLSPKNITDFDMRKSMEDFGWI